MEKQESLTSISGASFHRGKSKQDYATPGDFRSAVTKRFTKPHWDLAADLENSFSEKPEFHYSIEDSSLTRVWSLTTQLLWLNPPFENIAPWARKCYEESRKGARILFLVPAAVGSNWFQTWVHDKSLVLFLNPRLCFDGKNPYPKDCLLACYNLIGVGYDCWRWKT